ncbi:MAG: hypothetical protein H7250_01010 [Flavobacterium sp.]|nr:hypothetical protein [Flavobacterium sp.]
MKLLYSILFSFLLLLSSLSNVFVYLNFKVHQEEIAKTLCVQREMKVNKCNGQCFLSKQLKKEAEKEKQETGNLREKQELVYLNSISENPVTLSFSSKKTRNIFSHRCEKPKSISFSIFRPPLV